MGNYLSLKSGLVGIMLSILGVGACSALTVSGTSITCSPSKKIQTIIDGVISGTAATINVTGTCNENIYVPAGKTIYLVGQSANQASSLLASDGAYNAAYVSGFLQITNMTVSNSKGSASPIQADYGGTVVLAADIVTTSSASQVIQLFNNSNVIIRNSRITSSAEVQDKTVAADSNSSLTIVGNSNFVSGPDGYKTSISGKVDAVACGTGSSLGVFAVGTGKVLISKSMRGINVGSCSLTVENQTEDVANIQIVGNSKAGLIAYNSSIQLKRATIASNTKGINSFMSKIVVVGVKFGGTLGANSVDISSGFDPTVEMDDFGGTTTFASVSSSSFRCHAGGKIYFDPAYVSPSLTSYVGDCLINVNP
ncbi:MAG: hypothetical protein WCO04_14450 [Pseudomonadota bacterium]